jgi:hypothetical protein
VWEPTIPELGAVAVVCTAVLVLPTVFRADSPWHPAGQVALAGFLMVTLLVCTIVAATTTAAPTSNVVAPAPGQPEGVSALVASVAAADRKAPLPGQLSPPVAQLPTDNEANSYPGIAGCIGTLAVAATKPCSIGPANGQVLVTFGDSHASMWLPALIPIAEQKAMPLTPIISFGCIPRTWKGICATWYAASIAHIQSLRPAVVVVDFCHQLCPDPNWDAEMLPALLALKQSGARVILIGDSPSLTENPTDCLLETDATMATCLIHFGAEQQAIDAADAATAKSAGAEYIDVVGWFCVNDECPIVIGTDIVYRDNGHITAEYVTALTGPLGAALKLG